MAIRPARPDDLPKLPAIEVAAGALFRDVDMPEIADDDPPTTEELAAAAALIVAVDDSDEPIAYARIEMVGGEPHLEQISVLPSCGGQGVGTRLLDEVAAWARDRGHGAVTLTTFRDVPFNGPLYARRGYEEVPEQEWTDAIRALVASEAEHGLDVSKRVVMRRRL